jgi:hypothetical protein
VNWCGWIDAGDVAKPSTSAGEVMRCETHGRAGNRLINPPDVSQPPSLDLSKPGFDVRAGDIAHAASKETLEPGPAKVIHL